MSFRAFRRTAATLLVAMLAVLACAEPSHAAAVRRHRSFDDAPGPAASLGRFISFLFQLFEQAGGGMDPNGFK
jgi:hypothetical protein